jgi:hypothetical protein
MSKGSEMPKFALPAAVLVLVSSLGTAAMAADGDLPLRQAGKWKLTTEMDEGRGPIKQSLTMCITDEMERNTASSSVSEHKANCSRYDVKTERGKTVVDSECAYAVDKVTSRTEMTGDFKSAFEVNIVTTTVTTPPSGKPLTRERKIHQVGEHLGADCGDIKPGEALAEDGSRVMVQ